MKKIVFALLLIATISTNAQELTWETNIEKAIAVSNKTNKPMLMFFTGSDWCGWCIKLQNEVLKTPEFAAWVKDKVVLVELDYPRRTPQSDELKMQNNGLQQAFAVQGYPTVWFAYAGLKDGKTNFEQIGKTGYVAGGPSKWLEGADEIMKNNKRIPVKMEDVKISKKDKKKKKEKEKVKS
jgi:protein disulfide-isomerase